MVIFREAGAGTCESEGGSTLLNWDRFCSGITFSRQPYFLGDLHPKA